MTILTVASIIFVVPLAVTSIAWSIKARKANDPLEALLKNIIENGSYPENLDNSYFMFLKKRDIVSIEGLNSHLIERTNSLGGLGNMNKENRRFIVLTLVACLLFLVVSLVAFLLGKASFIILLMMFLLAISSAIFNRSLYNYHRSLEKIIGDYLANTQA